MNTIAYTAEIQIIKTSLTPTFPPEFTIDHIKEWNETFAGKEVEVVTSHPSNISRDPFDGSQHISAEEGMKGGHKPNHTLYRAGSLLLPSVWWMDEQGLIDWKGIKNVRNYSYLE
ncbi:hypothetical protein A3D78_04330 [Candidatus Gottesmanbacteria bacterium RIFCSPHIGHO2_02_FULL_39_14]|uniref:Uncharacterized protein n=1 Tax=Candidatus Gottesmanbacteria bacterium RIFCSPHIGHO2_02_FULL_39_14 TaxID=1798383 RepID=A0A1F6A483_9BACT|nr:MAG: hypothetical protein A3D78_04330 [Candidatus Gottesmanbacteria bacterium RIFCSPHIGHO2_02_FULL_39_14]